jgi:hypothetical protein
VCCSTCGRPEADGAEPSTSAGLPGENVVLPEAVVIVPVSAAVTSPRGTEPASRPVEMRQPTANASASTDGGRAKAAVRSAMPDRRQPRRGAAS